MPSCIRYNSQQNTCNKCKSKGKCSALYLNYKKKCKIRKCKYPLNLSSSYDEFRYVFDTLKNTYYKTLECIDMRKEHSRECISPECVDEGHTLQIKQVENSNNKCLELLYKLSRDVLKISEHSNDTKWLKLIEDVKRFTVNL